MNTAQHTPGPWTMDRGTPLVVMDRRGAYVAQCDGISATIGSTEEMIANANLIAAAPDLLAALKAIVGECDGGTHDGGTIGMNLARAAIAKAEAPTP